MPVISSLLDRLFGPRVFVVVADEDGDIISIHDSRVRAADTILRAGLRQGPAARLARRLRQKAEDTPQRIGPWED